MDISAYLDRRDFLRRTTVVGGALVSGPFALGQSRKGDVISLVADPADRVASAAPVRWAAQELQRALSDAGFTVRRRESPNQAATGELCIIAAGTAAPLAAAALKSAGLSMPNGPESLALLDTRAQGRRALLACGADARGLVYALLELADRVRLGPKPEAALTIGKPVVERPANKVRSIMRQFTSEPLDKPWYYDREMWPRYLSMLAAQRFNRFHLAFGLGYDTLRQVADSYFLFLYPFLISAPGFAVRATNLPDGVKRCGREVEIDLHAKGIDAAMIDNALATGMPVNVAPKYWAEHLGMPYHQTAIRDLEMPVPGRTGAGLMTLSEGARVFTRYGYADLMRDDRKYTIRHRVFAGTQRLLMWGDPAAAAAYSRMFGFCGSTGADLMEPLTCRGRRGTGGSGRRSGYADAQWEPRWDWEKYTYWYRVWGRLMYDPQTDPEVTNRHFGAAPAARALESSLAHVSRILPIVTTAHLPSAACDAYWPEVYWNQPMVGEPRPNPYGDTPAPRTFQNVSPLDPQLFSRISDFAKELLEGERSGKYSPIEVAQWLEDFASRGEKSLLQAGKLESLEFRRLAIDVDMQVGLGRFFAAKFRSGVLYAIHERSGDRRALEEALKAYRRARSFWAQVADRAKGVYAADLSASDKISNRGQWLDRLPAIDADIARMEERLASAKTTADARVDAAILEVLGLPRRDPAQEARGNLYRASIPAGYTDSPYPLQYYFELKEGPAKEWLYPGFAADLANQPYFVVSRA